MLIFFKKYKIGHRVCYNLQNSKKWTGLGLKYFFKESYAVVFVDDCANYL